MILILDFGLGNIRSVQNMLRRVTKEQIVISSSIQDIEAADRFIFPGVGHFDTGMRNLGRADSLKTLRHRVLQEKIPVLGICLGMQLMSEGSEEGVEPGLGWVPGHFVRFRANPERRLRVPHMGWNTVSIQRDTPLLFGFPADPRFYFVHSFYLAASNSELVTGICKYDVEFAAIYVKENIYGVQFHPEKSHVFGLHLIRNFCERC
jgi:glutamine amidotransferase